MYLNRFFSVRCQPISIVEISSIFEQFGSIEKIEIFPEKFPLDEYPFESYAYVTYGDVKSAANALRPGYGIMVLPADTWKLPASPQRKIRRYDEGFLQELNDACLLHIFGYCDLPTLINLCKISERFSTLIGRHVYPKREEVEFSYHTSLVATTRKIAAA